MKIFKKRSVWTMITIYLALWLTISIIAGVILDGYKNTINRALGLTGTKSETIVTDKNEDTEYFKSNYVQKNADGSVKTVTDADGYTHQVYDDQALWNEDVKKADQVQREGTTILWNSSTNGLPLAKGNKVSLFSHSSVDYVYSSDGSGMSNTVGAPTMKSALTAAGLSVNNTLWNFYSTGAGKSYTRLARYNMNDVPWSKYTDDVKSSFASYGDAAILILSRKMGEGSMSVGGAKDATTTMADTPSGDYFDMSHQERKTLEELIKLKKSGTFKKVIVLLNTPTDMWFAPLFEHKSDIDSCVWVGHPGWEGLNEVGRILTGESIPSGHLVDTFLQNTRSSPAYVNAFFTTYTNGESMDYSDVGRHNTYLIYAENIYVGYKYYETRYEDAVLGRGNATSTAGAVNSQGNWKYSEEVAFPFGYGGSYTTFAYSDYKVTKNADGNYDVTVTVKNTGSVKGADAVQVYVQKPYTEYDVTYGLEQSAVNLAGYAKTSYLEPGASETVKITVDDEAFRTYDDENKKTYIREKGTYYITAAEDAHAAVNNILAAKGKTPANTNGVMDAQGNVSLVKSFDFATDDFTTYAVSETTGNAITNQFEDTDYNKYTNGDGKKVTYLSRNDWQGTYPISVLQLDTTDGLIEDLGYNFEVEANPYDKMPLYEQTHQYNLIDLRGLDYDHTAWDTLLDQLSLEEQIQFIGKAYLGTPAITSINKPADVAKDGPLGVGRFMKYQTNLNTYVMSFPSTVLLAASYNDTLAYEVGALMGEDCLHTGVTGLYGPGANIHRTTYGGRSFEYYSEDGFMSGMMCKQQVMGVQSVGCYVNIKHFALNDQESNRYGAGIWANEQSIREVYLEAFRYVVEEGDCTGLMSSFTRFGTKWSGAHKGLCTEVLRNEWGFKGFVLSDCAWRYYMGVVDGVMAGNDNILYEGTDLTAYYAAKDNATIAKAIRESTHRVLYVAVNSNAMNGISSNTRIYEVKEWWQILITNVQITLGIITGILLVITLLTFVFHEKIMELCGEKIERVSEPQKEKIMENLRKDSLDEEPIETTPVGGNVGGDKNPKSLKTIIITAVCAVLIIAIVVSIIVLPSTCNPNPGPDTGSGSSGSSSVVDTGSSGGDVDPDPDPTPSEPSLKDELEGDIKDYRFEAECGDLVTTIANCGAGLEGNCTLAPSGSGYIYMLNQAGTATITFKVHSAKAQKAVLSLGMGLGSADRDVNDMFEITINDNVVVLPNPVVFPQATEHKYFQWTRKELAIVDLKEGENVIVFTKTKTNLNFDYFDLSAADKVQFICEANNTHEYDWFVVSYPTENKEGTMGAYCKTCRNYKTEAIPALSEANGWTKEILKQNSDVNFGSAKWTRTFNGQKLSIESRIYPTTYATYKFEAEKAKLGGYAKVGEDASGNNPSGGAYVGNISGQVASMTLEINSDKDAQALFVICFGCRNDGAITLADGRTLTVNGTKVDIPSSVVFPAAKSTFNYFNWQEFEVVVLDLKAGKNTIVLSNAKGKGFSNVDYFTFTSAATLSQYVEE